MLKARRGSARGKCRAKSAAHIRPSPAAIGTVARINIDQLHHPVAIASRWSTAYRFTTGAPSTAPACVSGCAYIRQHIGPSIDEALIGAPASVRHRVAVRAYDRPWPIRHRLRRIGDVLVAFCRDAARPARCIETTTCHSLSDTAASTCWHSPLAAQRPVLKRSQ